MLNIEQNRCRPETGPYNKKNRLLFLSITLKLNSVSVLE